MLRFKKWQIKSTNRYLIRNSVEERNQCGSYRFNTKVEIPFSE